MDAPFLRRISADRSGGDRSGTLISEGGHSGLQRSAICAIPCPSGPAFTAPGTPGLPDHLIVLIEY